MGAARPRAFRTFLFRARRAARKINDRNYNGNYIRSATYILIRRETSAFVIHTRGTTHN